MEYLEYLKDLKERDVLKNGAWMLLLLIGIIMPIFPAYYRRLVAYVCVYIILSVSWNVIGGQTGYASFGNVAFFGIGGYVAATLMTKMNFPFLPCIPIAGLIAAGFAALIGYPILRLKGHYFSICTLGLALAILQFISNISYLGAADGMTLPLVYGDLFFYYAFLSLAIITILTTYYLGKIRFLSTLNAIRDDEEKAIALGVPATHLKTLAWAISAFFGGVTGALYAAWFVYIEPRSAFSDIISMTMVLMAVLGGLYSFIGPIIGAILLQTLAEIIWTISPARHPIVLGLVLVLVVRFMPEGIVGYVEKRFGADQSDRTNQGE